MQKWKVLLAVSAFLADSMSGQPNKTARNGEAVAAQSQPAVVLATPDHQNSSQTYQSKPEADPPKWYAPFERPDWWLVLAAFMTCGVVGWQSYETRKSAEATRDSVQLMMDKERARLRIEIEDLEFPDRQSTLLPLVRIKTVLEGSTLAYVLDSGCSAGLRARNQLPNLTVMQQHLSLPALITPTMGSIESGVLILSGDTVAGSDAPDFNLSAATIQLVRENDRYVFCEGYIRYKGIFRGEWVLKFKKKWQYFCEPAPESGPFSGGQWVSYGEPEDNAEHEDKNPN
jgi:hypothetical protein